MGLFDWFIDVDGNGKTDEFDFMMAMALIEDNDGREDKDDFDLDDGLENF